MAELALDQFSSKLLDVLVAETKGRVINEALEILIPQLNQKVERITFTTEEAAVYLGVSEQTLRSMCQQKQIPHIRAKTKYLFRKKTLDEWLERQEAENSCCCNS